MKKIIIIFLISMFIISCANNKDFRIDGNNVTIEPYGWFDMDAKNKNIRYKLCVGNIILSAIFCETLLVPVLITGLQLWEPIEYIPKESKK
jgi:hypothetical protein